MPAVNKKSLKVFDSRRKIRAANGFAQGHSAENREFYSKSVPGARQSARPGVILGKGLRGPSAGWHRVRAIRALGRNELEDNHDH